MLRKVFYNLVLMLVCSSFAIAQDSHPNGATFNNGSTEINKWGSYYPDWGIELGDGYVIKRSYYPAPGSGRLEIGSGDLSLYLFGDQLSIGTSPYNVITSNNSHGVVFGTDFNVQNDVKIDSSVHVQGALGVGTDLSDNPKNYKLAVNGRIGAKEVVVENTSSTWGDYVFNESYDLRSLNEVESYIEEHNHLPGIPSADAVSEKGISLGELTNKQMVKIEELTLHMIEMKKELKELKQENEELEEENTNLKKHNKQLKAKNQRLNKMEEKLSRLEDMVKE